MTAIRMKPYRTVNGRRNARLKTGYLVRYRLVNGPRPDEFMVGHTKDLSAGGLRFWSRENLEAGSLVHVQILLPPWTETVSAFGRIVRVWRPARPKVTYAAVEFLEIPAGDQDRILKLVESRRRTRESSFLFDEYDVVERSKSE